MEERSRWPESSLPSRRGNEPSPDVVLSARPTQASTRSPCEEKMMLWSDPHHSETPIPLFDLAGIQSSLFTAQFGLLG